MDGHHLVYYPSTDRPDKHDNDDANDNSNNKSNKSEQCCDGPLSLSNVQVTVTDNDIIEKSNLNRQFLFRPHHIQVGSNDHIPPYLPYFILY